MDQIHWSEIIASRLCKQLTSQMDYKSLKLKLQSQRQQKSKDLAIDYSNNIFEQVSFMNQLQPQNITLQPAIKVDQVQKSKEFGLARRVSIVKNKRSFKVEKSLSSSVRSSKKFIRGLKQSQKGLIKLTIQQQDVPSLAQYIDKLRQKKIKIAEAMQQFDQKQKLKQSKPIKSPLRETNNSDKAFITTLSGQLIKCEKKQTNSKKDDIYLQKLKIKPIFRLKQLSSTKKDLFNKNGLVTQTRRASITKDTKDEENKNREDNYFIKSIIDVIKNRDRSVGVRRKRNMIR